ncbi:MAG: transporter substrate-binding domain-containing protein [Spirochaetales bacterium]|nr:transporter substrate-binding domain-containing protein [Spirochaetales bacterium]
MNRGIAIKIKLFLILLLFLHGFFLGAFGPEDLIYITEDYAPSNYMEDGELKGVAVELLKAIWARMGVEEQPIEVYPWARGYQIIQNRSDAVLFAMTRSPERENLFKWVGPIYRGRYSLMELSGQSPGFEDDSTLQNRRYGAIRNDLGYHLLLKEGISADLIWEASNFDQLVKMLEAGRIDFISIYEDSVNQYASESRDTTVRFQTVKILSENVMYYAFNREADDKLVGRFQNALNEIEEQRIGIVDKYYGVP